MAKAILTTKVDPTYDDLPEEQRKCIRLFYFDNKSYAEISSETGFELKGVKSFIQNGRRNLKIWLEKKID